QNSQKTASIEQQTGSYGYRTLPEYSVFMRGTGIIQGRPITLGKAGEQVCYRVIKPTYAGTPLSGAGAARQGGRFNRPGQEALYLSTDETTALAEYKQDNPWLPPGTICTFFLRELRVADFSAGFDSEKWPPLWSDFSVDWRAEWFGKSIE